MPATFRTAVEAHDFDAVGKFLADDVTMRSPIAHRAYCGRAAVIDVLRVVSTVLEDFAYEHEIRSSSGDGPRLALHCTSEWLDDSRLRHTPLPRRRSDRPAHRHVATTESSTGLRGAHTPGVHADDVHATARCSR
jgi:hypothetical protein